MAQKKILIIDDNDTLREALRDVLATAGFETLEASDGELGLSKALVEKPDLILLDVNMPTMNGHQTLAELRKDAWGKDVSVILLTAMDDATNVTRGIELKSDDYIIKSSASLGDIVKKVKQHLAGYHD